ncbi:MAG: glycoside hydrolase family 25 protein [Erysipelotrichaceae bacterium]|nr:glycoside hydrolase family 25 protein [Erysipelotrichaceae bacterium]
MRSSRTALMFLIVLLLGVVIGLFIGKIVFTMDKDTYILKSELKELGISYKLSTAFLRDMFKDEIVYLDNGEIKFVPIDPDLELHDHDWSNIVVYDDHYDYIVDERSIVVHGIDISKFQGSIDWQKVSDTRVKFAIMRLGYRGYSEGEIFLDDKFHDNMQNAVTYDIDVGVYFFSQAINTEEAIAEADFVLDQIVDYPITYPIVFDMEDIFNTDTRIDNLSTSEITAITKAFCDRIRDAGYVPMIYGNSHWLFSKLDLHEIKDYAKWYAQYDTEPYYPYNFDIWQYSNTGQVDGIAGNVDLNISFTDYANR